MKNPWFQILFALLLGAFATAQNTYGPWYVIAVGDPPLPKLKVSSSGGYSGYEAEENSPELVFPNEWELVSEGGAQAFPLRLNQEAVVLPSSTQPVVRVVPARSAGAAPGSIRNHVPRAVPGPAVILIVKSKSGASWAEGYDSLIIPCSLFNPARPSAQVVNLGSVPIHHLGENQTRAVIPPGAISPALMMLHQQSATLALPLHAEIDGRRIDLSVAPIHPDGRYSPLVVIHPSGPPASRPLRTSLCRIPTTTPLTQSP